MNPNLTKRKRPRKTMPRNNPILCLGVSPVSGCKAQIFYMTVSHTYNGLELLEFLRCFLEKRVKETFQEKAQVKYDRQCQLDPSPSDYRVLVVSFTDVLQWVQGCFGGGGAL